MNFIHLASARDASYVFSVNHPAERISLCWQWARLLHGNSAIFHCRVLCRVRAGWREEGMVISHQTGWQIYDLWMKWMIQWECVDQKKRMKRTIAAADWLQTLLRAKEKKVSHWCPSAGNQFREGRSNHSVFFNKKNAIWWKDIAIIWTCYKLYYLLSL